VSTKKRSSSRILPRDAGAAPLDVVIAVMAFLAALALGASLVAERAASGWRAGFSDRLTVQVMPPPHSGAQKALDAETAAALSVLRSTSGIAHASALSESDTTTLVAPWLGKDAIIAELPLPRLIDATIVPGTEVDISALSRALKQAAPDAVLDDHRRWLKRLSGLADTVIWSAVGILALIAVATASTVAFATRAGLEAHHEMVALLHQMGAHAGFIARAFERHYFVSALLAAAAGAVAAAALFVAAGGLELAGVEAVPFLPPIGLKLTELPWLLAVPIASAVIAFVTARISVLAALRNIY
jgi:cell division transport system permease protein